MSAALPADQDPSFAGDLACGCQGARRRLLCGLAASAFVGVGPGVAAAAPAQPGEAVVWPTVRLLDGSQWGPAQAADRTVLVVFWSTTCPFCLRHNAHIEKLRRAATGRPLTVLTVCRDRDPAVVSAYLARNGYGFAVTLDHPPMAAALSSRRVIPLSVLVDRRGRLAQVVPGEMFEEDVMEWLARA